MESQRSMHRARRTRPLGLRCELASCFFSVSDTRPGRAACARVAAVFRVRADDFVRVHARREKGRCAGVGRALIPVSPFVLARVSRACEREFAGAEGHVMAAEFRRNKWITRLVVCALSTSGCGFGCCSACQLTVGPTASSQPTTPDAHAASVRLSGDPACLHKGHNSSR